MIFQFGKNKLLIIEPLADLKFRPKSFVIVHCSIAEYWPLGTLAIDTEEFKALQSYE